MAKQDAVPRLENGVPDTIRPERRLARENIKVRIVS